MRIYVLGDSISIQYGMHLQRYLHGQMEYARKEAEEEVRLDLAQPQGANGGDSSMVLAFLLTKAAAGGIACDLLLVNCGLHDIKTDPQTGVRQNAPDTYEANLRAIVKTVAGMQPRMIWIRTTPCDEAIHNHDRMAFHRFSADCRHYNRIADRVMAAADIPAIDLHTFTVNLGSNIYCDHVHFYEHIREKQAAYIAGWLGGYLANRNKT